MDEFINVEEFGAIGSSHVNPDTVAIETMRDGGAVVTAYFNFMTVFKRACKTEGKARKIAATLFDRTFPKPDCETDERPF